MARDPGRMQVGNSDNFERGENRRIILYIVVALAVILIVGFLAGLIDDAVRPAVRSNAFVDNAGEMLTVVAGTAPWLALALVLCACWVFVADRLFVRWNRAYGEQQEKDKGLIWEIVHDNNSAAALVLLVPLLIIVLSLMYVSVLNLPYNLRDALQDVLPATPTPRP